MHLKHQYHLFIKDYFTLPIPAVAPVIKTTLPFKLTSRLDFLQLLLVSSQSDVLILEKKRLLYDNNDAVPNDNPHFERNNANICVNS